MGVSWTRPSLAVPRRTRRFPSTDASVKEERRTSRSTEGRRLGEERWPTTSEHWKANDGLVEAEGGGRLSGLFGGIEESEAATAAAPARFLSRRGRTCPHTPAVKRRRSHLPASLVSRRGEHDGQHELVEDLLGGANVGLVVDLLLLKQSEHLSPSLPISPSRRRSPTLEAERASLPISPHLSLSS